jgi:hypothetical protein
MTIALLQPHSAIQDPGFLTKIMISHDYEERFYKNWRNIFTKNLGYSMQNVCNNVAYCKIILNVILQFFPLFHSTLKLELRITIYKIHPILIKAFFV